MANVLFVTRQYFPHGDATSQVVHHLAGEFLNRGWDVRVLAMTNQPEDVEIREWEGVQVDYACLPGSMDREQFKTGLKRDFFRTVISAGKLFFSMMGRKNEGLGLVMNPLGREALGKKISEIQHTGKIDFCIATLMPAEAAGAARDALDEGTVFAVYQLDTFWNNESLQAKHLENRKQFEKRLTERADFVVTTPLIRRANEAVFPEYKEKLISAEFPMIREAELPVDSDRVYKDGRTHCAFLGRLYKSFRPPERMVRMMLRMEEKEGAGPVFDFYGTGQHLIRAELEKEKKHADSIQLHGAVQLAEARRIMGSADFLVNIDNTTTLLVPSKIFEYISTGKPLINFYFNGDSPTLGYLERYPNCVNVYLYGEPGAEIKKLEAFIHTAKGRRIPFSEVRELYRENTPEYVCDLFCREYDSAKGRQP